MGALLVSEWMELSVSSVVAGSPMLVGKSVVVWAKSARRRQRQRSEQAAEG
jgi:hypothetical protein